MVGTNIIEELVESAVEDKPEALRSTVVASDFVLMKGWMYAYI